MAIVTVALVLPDLTIEDLKALVVAHDDAEGPQPIKPEYVTPADAMQLWFSGEFPNVLYTIEENWIDT